MYGTEAVLAVNETSVPWATILVRKSLVSQQLHFGNNPYVLAWPSSESGALPLEGGVAVAFAKEIASADNPDKKERK